MKFASRMKRIFLAIVGLLFCFTAHSAQPSTKCYIYGVDFSEVQVYGALESEDDFAEAFKGINMLFITEPSKYDMSLVINRYAKLMLGPVMEVLEDCDFESMKTYDNECPEIDYAECVEYYDIEQEDGIGVVLIAKFLNKPEKYGEYAIVIFDIASRKVLKAIDVRGDAGGFGLRNFWARSVYNAINSVSVRLP
jgi:hypothetical protein